MYIRENVDCGELIKKLASFLCMKEDANKQTWFNSFCIQEIHIIHFIYILYAH